jgi:hypothetical protein
MLGVVQDSAGEKLFWATTGAFAYHWVAVGASGVVQKQRGLAQKCEVSTNYNGWRKPQLNLVTERNVGWAHLSRLRRATMDFDNLIAEDVSIIGRNADGGYARS